MEEIPIPEYNPDLLTSEELFVFKGDSDKKQQEKKTIGFKRKNYERLDPNKRIFTSDIQNISYLLEEKRQDISKLREKKDELEDTIKTLKGSVNTLTGERVENTNAKEEALDKLEIEIKKSKELEKTVQARNEQIQKREKFIEEMNNRVKELEYLNEELDKKNKIGREDYDKIIQEGRKMEREFKRAMENEKNMINGLKSEAQKLKKDVTSYQEELLKANNYKLAADTEIAKLNKNLRSTNFTKEELVKSLKQLKSAASKLQGEFIEKNTAVTELAQKNELLVKKLEEIKIESTNKVIELEKEVGRLTTDLDTEKENNLELRKQVATFLEANDVEMPDVEEYTQEIDRLNKALDEERKPKSIKRILKEIFRDSKLIDQFKTLKDSSGPRDLFNRCVSILNHFEDTYLDGRPKIKMTIKIAKYLIFAGSGIFLTALQVKAVIGWVGDMRGKEGKPKHTDLPKPTEDEIKKSYKSKFRTRRRRRF